MGQAEYNTVRAARDGATTEISSLITAGLIVPEIKFLGTVIYQTSNTYSNTVQSRIRSTDAGDDYVDLRDLGVVRGGTSGTITDHGSLAGLDDDDHLQYLNLQTRKNLNVDRHVYDAVSHNDLSLTDSWDTTNLSNATLTSELTNYLSGTQSYLLTNVTGSAAEYMDSKDIAVPLKARGKINAVTFPYTYDGDDGDITVQIYDNTNTTLLGTALDVEASDNGTITIAEYFPSTTASIKLRVTVDTVNNGKLFVLDDLTFTDDPFVYKNLLAKQDYLITQAGSSLTNAAAEIEFNLGTASITDNGDQLLVASDDSGSTRTKFTAQKECEVFIHFDAKATSGGTSAIIYKNGAQFLTGTSMVNVANFFASVSGPIKLAKDDFISVGLSAGTVQSSADLVTVSIIAYADTEHVVHASAGTENTFSARITSADVITTQSSPNAPAIASVSSTSTGLYAIVYTTDFFGVTPAAQATAETNGLNCHITAESATGCTVNIEDPSGTLTDSDFSIILQRQGTDYKNPNAYAVTPVSRIAYLKHIETSGTAGGSATGSGTFDTRTLNTLEGDTSFVSLSSNRFTLPAGKYKINGWSTAFYVDEHKAKLVADPGGTPADAIIGSSEMAAGGGANTSSSKSHIVGKIEITVPTTYEIQHAVTTALATQGLGRASSLGTELYACIEVTKLK